MLKKTGSVGYDGFGHSAQEDCVLLQGSCLRKWLGSLYSFEPVGPAVAADGVNLLSEFCLAGAVENVLQVQKLAASAQSPYEPVPGVVRLSGLPPAVEEFAHS